ESKFFVPPSNFTSFSLPRGVFYCDDFLLVRAGVTAAAKRKNILKFMRLPCGRGRVRQIFVGYTIIQ
ncbi:MAG: hypothetical protein FWC55_05055, partial [Firmicutes bacterium]|nr:hypothetical protein [Bacillota bacterium]